MQIENLEKTKELMIIQERNTIEIRKNQISEELNDLQREVNEKQDIIMEYKMKIKEIEGNSSSSIITN